MLPTFSQSLTAQEVFEAAPEMNEVPYEQTHEWCLTNRLTFAITKASLMKIVILMINFHKDNFSWLHAPSRKVTENLFTNAVRRCWQVSSVDKQINQTFFNNNFIRVIWTNSSIFSATLSYLTRPREVKRYNAPAIQRNYDGKFNIWSTNPPVLHKVIHNYNPSLAYATHGLKMSITLGKS